MSCTREDLKARITDVLVGEAEPSMREAVFAHAETCDSCRDDRERVASVLGLLKDAPPWRDVAAERESDALSTIQRQRIMAAARPRKATKSRSGPGPMSWLVFAAGLSAVGVALVLARRAHEVPLDLEAPVPAAVTSSVLATPVAPEGPMLPRRAATPVPPPVAPAAIRESAPMEVEVSKEAMQEFKKPVESVETAGPRRAALKSRREDKAAGVAAENQAGIAAPAPVAALPVILQVEGARDPLQEGASVVRVVIGRADASGVACVEFDAAAVSRPSRLGASRPSPNRAAPCAGDRFDVQAGPSSASLFAITARSGPRDGVIGRVTLRDAGREVAARPIERAEVSGAFESMPADFRIAYIEARLAEPTAPDRRDLSRSLLPLAEALPDSPVARDLLARVRSAARP